MYKKELMDKMENLTKEYVKLIQELGKERLPNQVFDKLSCAVRYIAGTFDKECLWEPKLKQEKDRFEENIKNGKIKLEEDLKTCRKTAMAPLKKIKI